MLQRVKNRAMRGRLLEQPDDQQPEEERSLNQRWTGDKSTPETAGDVAHAGYAALDKRFVQPGSDALHPDHTSMKGEQGRMMKTDMLPQYKQALQKKQQKLLDYKGKQDSMSATNKHIAAQRRDRMFEKPVGNESPSAKSERIDRFSQKLKADRLQKAMQATKDNLARSARIQRFTNRVGKSGGAPSMTPKLDQLGDSMKMGHDTPKTGGRKVTPDGVFGPQKELPGPSGDTARKPAARRSLGGRLGVLGKGAIMGMAYGMDKMGEGFTDRMRQYESMREGEEGPRSQPNPKGNATDQVPTTSTMVSKKSVSSPGKLRPSGGVQKAKKPQTSEGPKKGASGKDQNGGDQKVEHTITTTMDNRPQPTPEEQKQQALQGRAGEFRARLGAISMVNSKQAPAPLAAPKKPQSAKESAVGFLNGVLNLRESARVPTEKQMAKKFKSSANTTVRQGTPVKHTFISNNGKHEFSGRALAMRQKILAEHKRKGFDLHPNFSDMSPEEIGEHFDYLSDQGMLENRPTLDKSYLGYWGRKTSRVAGRLSRKVRSFLGGVAEKTKDKVKESESPKDFCDFSVGNVKYPGECGCGDCLKLVETAATSFGQNMRGPTQDMDTPPLNEGNIHEDIQKRKFVISRLMSKKRRKKRVRESYEDTIRREVGYHRRNPEPSGITRRPHSYYQAPNLMRRLDTLGMTLAKTALLAHGLAPTAQSLLWKYQDNAPQFIADAKRTAALVHAALVGKLRKLHESGFEKNVERAGAAYAKKFPRFKEFVDKPWDTVKNAAHHYGTEITRRVAKATGSETLKTHAYPIGKAVGYGGLLGTAYAAKRLIYDPLKSKAQQTIKKHPKLRRVEQKIDHIRNFKDEMDI